MNERLFSRCSILQYLGEPGRGSLHWSGYRYREEFRFANNNKRTMHTMVSFGKRLLKPKRNNCSLILSNSAKVKPHKSCNKNVGIPTGIFCFSNLMIILEDRWVDRLFLRRISSLVWNHEIHAWIEIWQICP